MSAMRRMMGPPPDAPDNRAPGSAPPDLKPGYVLVRLSTASLLAAQARDLVSSLILAGVVFFSTAGPGRGHVPLCPAASR